MSIPDSLRNRYATSDAKRRKVRVCKSDGCGNAVRPRAWYCTCCVGDKVAAYAAAARDRKRKRQIGQSFTS